MKTTILLFAIVAVLFSGPMTHKNNLFASMMYWTDTGSNTVYQANLDGSEITSLVVIGPSNMYGIALDLVRGKMYWTDGFNDRIQHANLDGSNIENLITNLNFAYGIAVDTLNAKVYWANSNKILLPISPIPILIKIDHKKGKNIGLITLSPTIVLSPSGKFLIILSSCANLMAFITSFLEAFEFANFILL